MQVSHTITGLILLVYLSCSSWVNAAGEFSEVTHFSDTLQKEKTFGIYIPEGEEETRYPVLYIMHGKWGSHADWPEKTEVKELAEAYKMILVFPDGEEFSWYLDSPLMEESQYETYITSDLLKYVDDNYPTINEKSARGIMGLSMGGHGALLLSAKHRDLYASASSLSGILKLTNHPTREDVIERLGTIEEHRDRWEANSVYEVSDVFADGETRILFDCGEKDTNTGAIFDNRLLHEKLAKLNIPHIYRELPGTHSWTYWGDNLQSHLNFHQAVFIENHPTGSKWFDLYFSRINEFLLQNQKKMPVNTLKICLFGSSSVQGFPLELLPQDIAIYNRGISGDRLGLTSRGLSHRMASGVFDMKPDIIIIKNGRNDLGARARSESGFPSEYLMVKHYSEIVEEIKDRLPDAEIMITTCAPVRGNYGHLKDSTASYNERLKEMAEFYDLTLIQLHDELLDEEGYIREELTNDGLHMKREGYQTWARLISQAMAER